MDPAQRAKQLREVLNHHSDLYYNQDAPEISDQEYDGLMRELKALEKAHPELITPDSPTQRVGGSAKRTAGVLVAHRVPMLSMQDLFTQEEVDHFISDCQEKLGEGITFLVETKTHMIFSGDPGPGAKEAITNYELLKSGSGYSLLDISIDTGRKNQIRVHMKERGCPIAGDKQYDARTNPIGRLCLHANELSFHHPATGQPTTFKAKMPRDFNRVFR